MREFGRGGSLVAATIAALHNRTAIEEKPRPVNSRPISVESRNVVRSVTKENLYHDFSRRASGGSERPLSTASEASERDSASVQSSEEPPPHESGDSDSPDEATVKCTVWTDGAVPVRANSSDSDSSSSSEDESDEKEYEIRGGDADYRTLTPNSRLDNSTRRDDGFKWLPTGELVDDTSNLMDSRTEEYSAASLDRRRRTHADRNDRDRKSRSSLSGKPPQHPSGSVRASPRPRRPRNEETPPELQRRWNSYEHFRWPESGWWPPMCWCHGPPAPPPCCMHERAWPSHPSLPPVPARPYKNDAEDRVRRLEADKENLQLQVQVLSEQIAAQSDKMGDLERSLHETRQRLDDAEQRLQKEMLQRSSLETQKLELLSKLSEVRLRVAERGFLERSPPPDGTPMPLVRPAPPRTPPANYGRQIERNTHMYSSLPRSSVVTSEARVAFGKQNNMVVARGHGRSVPNLAEKEEVDRGSPSPSLREMRARLGSARLEGDDLARRSMRGAGAGGGGTPRTAASLLPVRPAPWQTIDVREWDCETTCGWLESIGLEVYVAAARAWLSASPSARGLLAAASHHTIEKELAIKHPMHKKKIVLALIDLMGGDSDPLLAAAGRLDTAWALRWLEDVGVCGARAAAADAALDGRLLHRLAHADLHAHLRVTHALHALAVRRGIQVLRDNKFNPDTMIRRAAEGETGIGGGGGGIGVGGGAGVEGGGESSDGGGTGVAGTELARWSSHRVMQWLKEIDLAEYAPNLRGAGVHGGLMLLEPRFTAELLAALLNIPASKTLLRRHLTQRFNELLGRDVIQQKRNAEQTLGYQPLTATTKYKVPKKSQFSLKRKKSKDEMDMGELVCPLHDDGSDDESKISNSGRRVGCLSPA
ncbi:liprin-beta-1 isoform X2 [Galleria mellonella]|uniref:Liprin-beta-1 isoform X2 n=1 Tax=Galleria mellonella TaxID=7137 RepID=A0ABM3N3Y3_GALME|nr:liprin-beta-1 isoform X2 [Galleria mellonella]